MSLSSYSDLKNAVTNWTKRSDLTNYLDDIIRIAELRIHREVKTHETETALSVTITGSPATATIPADFVSLKNAYIDIEGTPALTMASADQIRQWQVNGSYRRGIPKQIAQEGSTFIFWPIPQQEYVVKGIYYATPGTLSSATYSLFTSNPDLFLYAALAETAPFLKDDKRIALWEAQYQKIKNQVLNDDVDYRFGGRLQITAA